MIHLHSMKSQTAHFVQVLIFHQNYVVKWTMIATICYLRSIYVINSRGGAKVSNNRGAHVQKKGGGKWSTNLLHSDKNKVGNESVL